MAESRVLIWILLEGDCPNLPPCASLITAALSTVATVGIHGSHASLKAPNDQESGGCAAGHASAASAAASAAREAAANAVAAVSSVLG